MERGTKVWSISALLTSFSLAQGETRTKGDQGL
jgi:hypothetical protein